NKSDGGNRKFILIELETEIAQNVTAKRLEKVIKGYEVEKGSGKVEKVEGLGSGFTYCKLGQTLFGSDGKIRESITFEELARHIFFLETKTPLTEKPNSPLIGKTEDLAVYLLYNGILKDKKPNNGNVLTTQVLADLPKFKGPKIIYGTSCRLSKQRLENYKIKFRQIPYDVGIS
ncbi:site-specific DNA-methyltransferase, partial [bacterium]|nr:site-specific DNA-methyltransferase [bacterium]